MADQCPTTPKTWIALSLCEPDGTPSSRRALFAIAVVFVLGLVTGAFCVQPTLTPELIDVLKTVLYVTGGTIAVGKFAEGAKE